MLNKYQFLFGNYFEVAQCRHVIIERHMCFEKYWKQSLGILIPNYYYKLSYLCCYRLLQYLVFKKAFLSVISGTHVL